MVANDRRAAAKAVFEVHYLFANDARTGLSMPPRNFQTDDRAFDSMATFYFPAARLEREISDMFGIEAIGHPPHPRLVRHSFWPETFYPLRERCNTLQRILSARALPYPFLPVEGEGVYEIPVGPVHAGIIEPGHFRFSVVGETVINLQMHLFFTHKGAEKLFEGKTPAEGVKTGRTHLR